METSSPPRHPKPPPLGGGVFTLAYSAAGKATQLLSFYLNFVSDKAT